MSRILRWFAWGMASIVVLLMLAIGGGYWWLLQALPEIDGRVALTGIEAPVEIVRDQHGIPHIEAETIEDALFAQGFAHAQDRLWQLEFQRRVAAGRLAEIVGEAALPTDRFLRMLGLYRLAEASLASLSPDTLAWLEAYAAGINAYLGSRSGPLPPEFLILGQGEIEPWKPADSVVWIKMMALDLGRNWRSELLRARLAKRLSNEQIADLWPDYPKDAPVTLAALSRGMMLDDLAAVLPSAPEPGLGSNAWLVSGAMSATGAPLLANDPHLGLRTPGVWYLAHLKAPELELIGAGLPGIPGIVLGHNGKIAWGMTNTGPDTQDLFIERVDLGDPKRYLTPGGTAAFELREEVIQIKDQAPVTLVVRSTRHGPVLSDLVGSADDVVDDDQVLALAWTALTDDDTSIETLFNLTKAEDWTGFRHAMRANHAPQQNVFYADQSGHVGFIAPGIVPVRKQGDGLWPVPGWSGAYDWIDAVPFDQLPSDVDPVSGMLLNGNNRIVRDDYPHLITTIWEPPYRARRIETLLSGRSHDLGSFAAIQLDQLSLVADDFLPIMLEMTPLDEVAASVASDLRGWDRVMRADGAEPLIFATWYRALSRLVYADELGPLFPSYWNIRPQFMERVLTEKPIWCDDQATDGIESCAELSAKALTLALDELSQRYGRDRAAWRWDVAHPARMAHPIFDGQPVLGDLFKIEFPTGGDSVSVNVGHYATSNDADPFASIQAATYRGLYDLADLDRSRFVVATGQSGHPLSPHYRDLGALWAAGETVVMERNFDRLRASATGRLRLSPAGE